MAVDYERFEKLGQAIGSVLEVGQATVTASAFSVELEFTKYSDLEVSYDKLMRVADLLGTTEFHVKFRRTDGYALSEATWEPGVTYLGIQFDPEKVKS